MDGKAALTALDRKFARIAIAREYLTKADLKRALAEIPRGRTVGATGAGDNRAHAWKTLPEVLFEHSMLTCDQIDAVFDKMFGPGQRPETRAENP